MPDENVQDKYKVTTWGGGSVDLEVPSGQLCLVRKSSLQTLMSAGIIHSMDMLTGLVDEKLIAPAEGRRPKLKPKPEDLKEGAAKLMGDPKKFEELMHLLDKVTCHIVLKPEIQMTPNDPTNRKDGVIYADQVDLEDKLFIFQYAAGGSTDLETFRDVPTDDVGGVDDESEAGRPPQ